MPPRPNFVVVMCDTLRRDHVGAYGGRVGTPSLDRLAAESLVFDSAYACSFPTLPCRAEVFSGKFVFPYLRWGPFPTQETHLAERLARAGYHTALIADNFPMSRVGYGYDRGFETKIHIPGQWYDEWRPLENAGPFPASESKLGHPERVRQYLANVSDRRSEEDYFAPQVLSTASSWVRDHGKRQPFFLWIDCFDPHEPWDPPTEYVEPGKVGGERIIYPKLGRASEYSTDEIEGIRALYAGEVRMVDRWLGRFLDTLDGAGLAENTVVVFLSDHGIFLGEQNLIGKAGKARKDVFGWPPYRTIGHLPFFVRAPGLAAGRTDAFVHPGDIAPTVLELSGLPVPDHMTTKSLAPVLEGKQGSIRDLAITSWSYRGWGAHHPSCIRDHEWSMIWWRTGIPPRLHHLPTDPGEERDVYLEHPRVARDLHGRYLETLKEIGCPARNYWPRRFFVSWQAPRPMEEAPVRAGLAGA